MTSPKGSLRARRPETAPGDAAVAGEHAVAAAYYARADRTPRLGWAWHHQDDDAWSRSSGGLDRLRSHGGATVACSLGQLAERIGGGPGCVHRNPHFAAGFV